MLDKDYSTPVILEASNVIDGGKQFSDVPVFLQGQVKELIESLGVDLSSDKPSKTATVETTTTTTSDTTPLAVADSAPAQQDAEGQQ